MLPIKKIVEKMLPFGWNIKVEVKNKMGNGHIVSYDQAKIKLIQTSEEGLRAIVLFRKPMKEKIIDYKDVEIIESSVMGMIPAISRKINVWAENPGEYEIISLDMIEKEIEEPVMDEKTGKPIIDEKTKKVKTTTKKVKTAQPKTQEQEISKREYVNRHRTIGFNFQDPQDRHVLISIVAMGFIFISSMTALYFFSQQVGLQIPKLDAIAKNLALAASHQAETANKLGMILEQIR